MKRNKDGSFIPGVIYELGAYDGDDFYPFYVGESTHPAERLEQHRYAAHTGRELLLYDYMRELHKLGYTTHMKLVEDYDEKGPADKEDEHIMNLLLQDFTLQNMKKGSAAWMDNMLATKDKMKATGHTSLREFKVWDAEQTRIANNKRHAERIAEENKIPLIDRIKAQTKFTDEAKLKQMQAQVIAAKAEDILNGIKR